MPCVCKGTGKFILLGKNGEIAEFPCAYCRPFPRQERERRKKRFLSDVKDMQIGREQ